jgi:hypothetical protein
VFSGWGGWIPFALPLRVGAGLELAPVPAPLYQIPDVDGPRRMSTYDLKGLAAFCPGPFELGGTIGGSLRITSDPTASPPPPGLIPTAGVVVALRAQQLTGFPLRFALIGDVDLAPTDLYYPADTPAGRLPRGSAGFSISYWTGDGSLSRRESTAADFPVR